MEKILITGANGYIGSRLIFYLNKKGIRPIALIREESEWPFSLDAEIRRGDLENGGFLSDATADADIIFHLAGAKGYDRCMEDISKTVNTNIAFTDRLIQAVRKEKIRIVFASTYWAYGYNSPVPYREEYPLMPTEPYGWSKALAEKMIMASGANYIIVRLANVFGFGMGKNYEEVTSLFLERALAGNIISLVNGGEHCVDLISIEDVTNLLASIIKLKEERLILNVGSGVRTSVLQLADNVNKVSRELTGNEAEIRKGVRKTDDVLFSNRWMDISRLMKLTGFKPAPVVSSIEQFAYNLLAKNTIT